MYNEEVVTIAKIYIDGQKYNRVNNSFDFKLTIFYNICKRASLPPKGYITVFLTMLKGFTQDHYYNSSLLTRLFIKAYNYIYYFFKGLEYYWKNLIE